MGKAVIEAVAGVGYVVKWFEDGSVSPLRNFGDYHSAAIEFRDYINNKMAMTDKLDKRVRGWAETYDPKEKYTYPDIRQSGEVTLRKQARYED